MKKLKTRVERIDPNTPVSRQAEIDLSKVNRFTEDAIGGAEFPAVRLVHYSTGYLVIDGHHRIEAFDTIEHSYVAIVADGDDFEQLDLDLRDAGTDKRADDIEFWDMDLSHYCVSCGAGGTVSESIEKQTFPVGAAPDPVIEVTCELPVMACSECEFEWTDHRGEEIRDKAAREQTPYFKESA